MKKILSMLLCAIMLSGLFVGCAKKLSDEEIIEQRELAVDNLETLLLCRGMLESLRLDVLKGKLSLDDQETLDLFSKAVGFLDETIEKAETFDYVQIYDKEEAEEWNVYIKDSKERNKLYKKISTGDESVIYNARFSENVNDFIEFATEKLQ